MKINDLLTEAKKPTPPKTRSPAAASLADRKYQQKIIPNKKKKTDPKHKKTVGMDENLNPGEYDMEGDSVKTNLHTIVRACKQLNSSLSDDQNLPEWVQDKIAQAKGMMVGVTEYMLSTGEREPGMNEQRSLAEPRIVTVGDDTQGLNDFRVVGPNHLSIYPFPAKQWNNEQHQARAKGYQLQYVGNDPAKAKAAAWPGETPKSRPMAVKEARKSAWDKMSAPFKGTSKDLDKSNARSQDALQGLKKSAKDYQNVVDKDKKTNEGTKKKSMTEGFQWTDYNSLKMDDILTIAETYFTRNNDLFESNDPKNSKYLLSLKSMSSQLVKNKKYIISVLGMVNDKVIQLQNPEVGTLLSKNGNSYKILLSDGTETEFPNKKLSDSMIAETFFFDNIAAYDKFRSILSLKYNLNLASPDQIKGIDDQDVKESTKQKGVDGKACWDGYKRMGTKKKGGKTVDNCVPTGK